MDERFNKINRLLSQYSLGQFDKRLALSPRLDEIDAFIAGVNMLGEELKAITISRNYFTNIFNSVSDMVFILDKKGVITNVNNAAAGQLEDSIESLYGKNIDALQAPGRAPLFKNLINTLRHEIGPISRESQFYSSSGKIIPVQLTAAYLLDESRKKKGILLTAKDISLQKKTENLIIRAIIDTQEKERQRLAQDLHDSLGQQLSAIKFFISAIERSVIEENQRSILRRSTDALTEVITDMRNICFNLMPKTLEEFGLLKAVKEICNKARYHKNIKFHIQELNSIPELPKDLEIDIYRVIQEFINNAIKHGNATVISLKFGCNKKHIKIVLQDNGEGFDNSKIAKGMGLKNVRSRVKSHNGEIEITSEIGRGTKYVLEIPITFNHEHL
ncbi:MAG: ATP-binding protein [Flavisolibacter sp.]